MDGTKDGSGRAKYDRVVALAHLDPIAYDQQRGGAAKKMGVRLSTLDREVAQCRAALGKKPSTPEEKPDLAKLAASAKRITECEDVLALFAQDFSQLVAGEEKNAKALYLVGTSRLFRKPMHAAIKGPSAAGKSELRNKEPLLFPTRGRDRFRRTVREGAALHA